jgi:hypothetical protein
MDAIPSNLCNLVEQLEDARQFHHDATRQAAGERCEQHREKSQAYAVMIAEIRGWEFRHRRDGDARHPGETGDRPDHDSRDNDGYAALLERVCRLHSAVAFVAQSVRLRATGGAMAGPGTATGAQGCQCAAEFSLHLESGRGDVVRPTGRRHL